MATESLPIVSAIVVNWNGASYLKDCLACLSTQTYREREIILVDNNSFDSSLNLVRKKFTDVQIVELDNNRSFTGGNLAGLSAAGGDFIALINNDMRAEKTGWGISSSDDR
jgi:GT2 family glycosyltransferase